jgi:geranylgeranyl diphosphate synthase type I
LRYHFGLDDEKPRRGKRLRPLMLLGVARTEAADDSQEQAVSDALAAACAIELLHNFSLIHDDIEDGDELRHGRQTVWSRYGVPHGINAGDALSAVSYLSILASGRISAPERAAFMAARLQEAHLAMCWGQGLDISFEHAAHVTYDQYLEMIAGKTAALFGAACALGALAANAPPERVDAYARMGEAYGRAFQIQDDVQGIWGDQAATGKVAAADLRRRKWSFPIVWALSRPNTRARQNIAQAYALQPPLDEKAVSLVATSLNELGARDAALAAAQAEWDAAEALAESAGLDRHRSLRRLFAASLGRT